MNRRETQVPAEPSALLTPREVCELLRVSRTTLHNWETAGLIHPVRLPSGHRRYKPEDIEAIKRGGRAGEAVAQ